MCLARVKRQSSRCGRASTFSRMSFRRAAGVPIPPAPADGALGARAALRYAGCRGREDPRLGRTSVATLEHVGAGKHAAEFSPAYRMYVIGLLTVVYMSNYADRMIFSVV